MLKRPTLALLVLVVAALAPGPASAAPPRVSPGSTYLALGDSVTFGYQEAQVVPPPNYLKASSFKAYPELAGRALHLHVFNAACPGETSTSFIDPSGPSNGCENSPGHPQVGYRRAFPLKVRYSGSQLSYAVKFLRKHRRTRLVSLMIGANDLFRCQTTTPGHCLGPGEFPAALATIKRNVRRIVKTIRRKARYRGQLVLVTYYSPDYSSAFYTGAIAALNQTLKTAAKPFRVKFADGFGQWRAASLHSGNNPCTAGLLTQLGKPGSCGVHPSRSGHGLLALALERVLRR